MKIISNKIKLTKFINNEKKLGFVPTMGALHKGHISLIKKSISQCNKTIVSIFINKPQFNNKSDHQKYPRTLRRDINILKKLKIDALYVPAENQIYPRGSNKKIKINYFANKLCGKYRPGHFKSVCDVIDRFIKIIKPKKIYLGEKDLQQLIIVDAFVKKKHKNVNIIACKTIRENNGVAFSSRNFLLTKKEKKIASKIYKLLHKKKNILVKNKKYVKYIKRKIINYGVKKIDYIEIFDVNKIVRPFKKNIKNKIFIAYYLSNTRLIDNI